MLNRAGKHVSDGLDPTMRMPWKSRNVIFRILIAEVVQKQKRIELFGFAETEGALQLNARALDRRLCFNNLFHCAE